MRDQQPRGAPQEQTFQDAVFLHRDIDPLVLKHLDHASKAALRVVSKAVKRAVDKTVRKVDITFDECMPVDKVMALLNAGWDLEELVFRFDDISMLLLDGIKGWTNLKKLGIDVSFPDSETYIDGMLSQEFVSSYALEDLDLSGVSLEDQDIKKLATLHWASNLKSLYLDETYLGPDSLHYIPKVLTSLTSLRLAWNMGLASQGVAPLAALTNLRELELRAISWTGQGLTQLAHSLTNLTSLMAGRNYFDGIDRHVSELSMPSLKKLDLEGCRLTPAFFSIKLDLPSLETLNLNQNELCADGVLEGFKTQRLPLLKLLELRSAINGDWLSDFVAAGHIMCPLLEELDLGYNERLGVAGMRALCNIPWKLKLLNIRDCNLGSEEVNSLAEGNLQWLQQLDLSHNRALKAEDLIALASTANMKNIKSISLIRTSIINSDGYHSADYYEFEQHIVELLCRA